MELTRGVADLFPPVGSRGYIEYRAIRQDEVPRSFDR